MDPDRPLIPTPAKLLEDMLAYLRIVPIHEGFDRALDLMHRIKDLLLQAKIRDRSIYRAEMTAEETSEETARSPDPGRYRNVYGETLAGPVENPDRPLDNPKGNR